MRKSWLCCLLLCACTQKQTLNVQNSYLSGRDLASVYVNTPDYRRDYPTVGQQIAVEWYICKEDYDPCCCWEIALKMRYCSRESDVVIYPLDKRKGTLEHELTGQDFFCKKGIRTFKVELLCNGSPVDEWMHQTWAEIIEIDTSGFKPKL